MAILMPGILQSTLVT